MLEPVSRTAADQQHVIHSPAAAADATRTLLARDMPPTALVYESDALAIGGIRQARILGLAVPDDLSD